MSTAIETLLTAAMAQNRQALIHSDNITKHNVDGHTRKSVQLSPLMVGGDSSGVQLSKIVRTVDDLLQGKVFSQNSKVTALKCFHDFLTQLQYAFGAKGQGGSFSHRLAETSQALDRILTDPSSITKINAVSSLTRMCENINGIAHMIQDLRTDTDSQLSQASNEVNLTLIQISELNARIATDAGSGSDVTILEDQRDMAIQKLSSLIDIRVVADGHQKKIFTTSGHALIFQGVPLSLSYTQSVSGAPGVALSNLMLGSNNITNALKGGKLYALLTLRDTHLPQIQQQLDEFTHQLRDTMNALHNQASPTNPLSTLIGTRGVPNLSTGEVQPLALSTNLSGVGTLRLGVVDSTTGKFAGAPPHYKDIPLGSLGAGGNFTLQQLIDAINTPAMGVTASLTSEGRFQLTTNSPVNGQGIVIGGVSGSEPRVCFNTGAGFVSNQSLGCSHYFGLNNLFETGDQLYYPAQLPPGTQATNGISNILSVRSSLVQDPSRLCCIKLYDTAAPPTAATIAVPPRELSPVVNLSKALNQQTHFFAATGGTVAVQTTLVDYAARMIEINSSLVRNNEVDYEHSKYVYDDLAKQNFEISGVDIQQEFYQLYQLRQSRTLVAKALNINMEMEGALVELIR